MTAVVGLITAIVGLRTAYRRNQAEEAPQPKRQTKRPFDDMLAYIGVMGMSFAPMLVILLLSGLTKFVDSIPDSRRKKTLEEPLPPRIELTINSVAEEHVHLYQLEEVAASMTQGRSRSDSLERIADEAIKSKEITLALVAAARMSQGRSRDDALAKVAVAAAHSGDMTRATQAVREMSEGLSRDDAAEAVMQVIEQTAKVATEKAGVTKATLGSAN